VVRIYDHEIEIIDPATMEIIRRHRKNHRPGSFAMQEEDRIYNPSRQTQSLLNKASEIGPETRKLCELLFAEQGRTGQRRMQGIVGLIRRYEACLIEETCRTAVKRGIRHCSTVRKIVRRKSEEAVSLKEDQDVSITQNHRLIRSTSDYGAFWKQHACRSQMPKQSFKIKREHLPQIWRSADWRKVIEVFNLQRDGREKPNEIWVKSPFTNEKTASLHLNLKENVFKDFSSGKGGGILEFCQDVLAIRGQSMNCYEVADWMIQNGISAQNYRSDEMISDEKKKKPERQNSPIKADLRRWMEDEHPYLAERGISPATCQYLGCGFLPERDKAGSRSPLNGRFVFQIRGVSGQAGAIKPVILSHVGRALTAKQEKAEGKYWGYPFYKGLEIYNQDKLLLDSNARRQIRRNGLILVEGYFDVARLVEAGFLNVGALMGAYITDAQTDRLKFIDQQVAIARISLFLDRDQAGISGAEKAADLLERAGFCVHVFDWNRRFEKPDSTMIRIPETIKDAADMSVHQLMWLRRQGII
jgi:hypothetical protein